MKITRVVERDETQVTRKALERAGWRCESCRRDNDLRVVEDRFDAFVVLCLPCRLDTPWLPSARARVWR
jgi:hypothetical protein